MIGCWKIYGEINITNLALPYSAVCSGLTGLLFSGLCTALVSLASTSLRECTVWIVYSPCSAFVGPDNYDFQGTRAIAVYDSSEESFTTEVKPRHKATGSEGSEDAESQEKSKVEVSSNEQDAPDDDALRSVFRKALYYSTALTLIVTIIGESTVYHQSIALSNLKRAHLAVPLPMFFSHYIFSKSFYTFWVACSMCVVYVPYSGVHTDNDNQFSVYGLVSVVFSVSSCHYGSLGLK